jgi:phage/plasmid-associated DNA primase
MAKLSQSYGTDSTPQMLMHPAPEELDREWSPPQKLLNFLMQRAGDQRLRRKNAAFYRPRLLSDNTHTGFYEYDREITEFIFQAVSPARIHPEYYDALTNKPSTPQQMINLLTGLPDPRSLFLVKDRTLFSYTNGVFNAGDGTFETYADRRHMIKSTSNYFDMLMTPDLLTRDPMNIETPNFEKILDDQDLDPCARRWMYALCGRLLHDVGSLDDWQVTLYIRGVAGSGKSSILKVMQMMYEACDTGFMMSDGQTTFCDEHLYDKHIVMAMDLDKKTLFSATRINSMTSGEKLINRKFKTALNTEWKPPMAMASNAQPP